MDEVPRKMLSGEGTEFCRDVEGIEEGTGTRIGRGQVVGWGRGRRRVFSE